MAGVQTSQRIIEAHWRAKPLTSENDGGDLKASQTRDFSVTTVFSCCCDSDASTGLPHSRLSFDVEVHNQLSPRTRDYLSGVLPRWLVCISFVRAVNDDY